MIYFPRPQSPLAVSLQRVAIFVMLCTLLVGCNSQAPVAPVETSSLVVQVTDQTFRSQVLESDQPVLVDMWAPWCPPCVEMKPALGQAAEQLQGEIKVVAVNVQENPFVDEKYDINQLPTLMLFVDGRVVEQVIGKHSRDELLELVQPYRASAPPDGR